MTEAMLVAAITAAFLAFIYGLNRVMKLSLQNLILGIAGTVVGLLVGALLSFPLSRLPSPYGDILPLLISLLFVLIFTRVFLQQRDALKGIMPFIQAMTRSRAARLANAPNQILVDTSVIIDGRIADVAKAGFIPGRLLVPRFILAELQNIADSDDSIRRSRGRRGLEILNSLQTDTGIEVQIIDEDPEKVSEVDAKLVHLAKQLGTDILTTDYNLNRVAQIEGVKVLNVNELSNAIRPVVLPGEEMVVKIVQLGKEKNQGVGYLPDGTMIVVEQGDKMVGQEIVTEVTRVFQTVAGKMIFATPRKPVRPSRRPPRHNRNDGQPNENGNLKNQNNTSNGSKKRYNPKNLSPGAIEDRLVRQNSQRD